ALAEIKTLKEFLRESFAAPSEKPLYQGKPAAFWLEQFKDGDPDYRAKAATALGALAHKNKDLIPLLAAGLSDKDDRVALDVSNALAELRAPESVPFVVEVLKARKSTSAMIRAANALGRIGAEGKPAVPFLAEALRAETPNLLEDWRLRRTVLGALGGIGKEAAPAIPTIRRSRGIPRLERREGSRRSGYWEHCCNIHLLDHEEN